MFPKPLVHLVHKYTDNVFSLVHSWYVSGTFGTVLVQLLKHFSF